MSHAIHLALQILMWIAFAAVVIWMGIHSLQRTEDPARLIFKWILTAGVIGVMATIGSGLMSGAGAVFIGIPFVAVCGVVLAIIWRHNLTNPIAKPFGSLYDG